jgi:hypothetical protein
VDESVDVQITVMDEGVEKKREEEEEETCLRPSRACLRMQRTTSSSIPPGQA